MIVSSSEIPYEKAGLELPEMILVPLFATVVIMQAILLFRRTKGRSKRVEARIKRTETINSIYRSILSAESFEHSLYLTIRAFKDHSSLTRLSVTLFDPEDESFVSYGITGQQRVGILNDDSVFPIEESGALPLLKQHKACLVQDVTKGGVVSASVLTLMEREHIRSFFICPLIGKRGELIGSLNFSSDLANAFLKEMIGFCEEAAHGIAFALNQYNLQEKVKAINETLEKKEKDITDSINYAKRIQQAMLPSKEQIQACIPNSFVLYKPKDIVSGDFYFVRRIKGLILIACADCTGHGVPGALMSMICFEVLDEAISQTTDTSLILEQLNKKIKLSLRQSDSYESSRDGMDIALCIIDVSNHIIRFAGANRPLWLIRNGQNVVEEIRGTKKAIGGFTEDSQSFDTHWIKLREGDTFYLFTDGYADTFGGKKKKKLTTRRFKEILIALQNKTIEEQRQYLDNFIDSWKGSHEQMDDILVMGMRL